MDARFRKQVVYGNEFIVVKDDSGRWKVRRGKRIRPQPVATIEGWDFPQGLRLACGSSLGPG